MTDWDEPLGPVSADWPRVVRGSYLVRQRFRYEYPAAISDLRHRLVILPPERFGDQRRLLHDVRASEPAERRELRDRFGNTVLEFHAPRVAGAIEFEARIAVERHAGAGPRPVRRRWLDAPALLSPTRLTRPDGRLAEAARRLAADGRSGLELAAAVNEWVHRTLRYQDGTDVGTTAAEALALGGGVCQDYAHVMLALCRLLGLPALYVSGHLMGEGGTHAWVEVVLPRGAGVAAWAFDPTLGRPCDMRHLTVAVGRDYRDVAPTSGVYCGPPGGRLTARKRVDVTSLELAA